MLEFIILGSGSAGNAAVLRGGRTTVLVDAGLSARRILQRLDEAGIAPESLDAILLTHEHGDHCGGLGVLLRRIPRPVFCTRLTADHLRDREDTAAAEWRLFATGTSFALGDLHFRTFSVPHDAADPAGFVVALEGRTLGFLTDLGHPTQSVIDHVRGVHTLFVEANHDEQLLQQDAKRPWHIKQRIMSRHGHLSNSAAAELAARAVSESLAQVVLGHLSSDCNRPELAERTVRERLDLAGRPDCAVHCAAQHTVMRFTIGTGP